MLPISLLGAAVLAQKGAEPLSIDLTAPIPAPAPIATNAEWSKSPSGHAITVDTASLRLDGRPVVWSMGEMHYSRVPREQWKRELEKVKAGGIDIVSTYVFWNHHEEIEGQWEWSGNKDLRAFVRLCGQVGLKVVVRGGPWVHSESRYGGLPDWIAEKTKSRSDDPAYMSKVAKFYAQIGAQLKGQLWKDGGPVVGFQVENEFGGPSRHLLNLKKLAIEAGIQVPLYTRTGWPALRTPIAPQELLPVYGGYAVGFWERGTAETTEPFNRTYLLTALRNPDDILAGADPKTKPEATHPDSPYLACEIGGGMATSYHRRLVVTPDEIASLVLVKIASGCNLPGYYMYHGGANPIGKLHTLNESQATGYWNDLPAIGYDFQAPIGQAGQLRPHYDTLRLNHLFLHDFGSELAHMPPSFPASNPTDWRDTSTLRWSVRSDGKKGYVFVNNFQRVDALPEKRGVQWSLGLKDGVQSFPTLPVDVPRQSYFFWPFNMDLDGVTLRDATAQPICRLKTAKGAAYFFAATDGVAPTFSFDLDTKVSGTGKEARLNGRRVFADVATGQAPAIKAWNSAGQEVDVFVFNPQVGRQLYKVTHQGKEQVWLTVGGVRISNGRPVVGIGSVRVFPPLPRTKRDGSFSALSGAIAMPDTDATVSLVRQPGPAREVKNGSQGVAEMPSDSDFESAGVWKITLPKGATKLYSPVLRIRYKGDCLRLYRNGKLVYDDFYNSVPVEIDLRSLGGAAGGELEARILPLRSDAPLYMTAGAKPDFGGAGTLCSLESVSIAETREKAFSAGPKRSKKKA